MNADDLSIPYHSLARLGWLVTVGIVYAQLIPFDFRAVPFDHAFALFTHIGWQDLRIDDPMDWASNLIMFVPFGFVVCGALSRWTRTGAIVLTAIFGAALAANTEFLQIWDSPRVCSLGDIVAQIFGTLIGIAIWIILGKRLLHTMRSVFAGGPQAVRAALVLYITFFCFVTLFPFDFFFSRAELHTRLSDPDAFVWLPRNLLSGRGMIHLIGKTLLMAPLGVVISLVWRRGIGVALLVALVLSSLLEALHWFEHSAQTDAGNVVVAMVGAALGNKIARVKNLHRLPSTKWVKRTAWLVLPLYVAVLPVLRGWHLSHASREQIEATLVSVNWLPFYYSWFVSESQALASTMNVAASFAPVGALVWAMRSQPSEQAGSARSIAPGVLTALLLSGLMEVGGLITTGHRPDPTNLLIAIAAAAFTQRACEWLARTLSEIPATAQALP